MSEESKGDGREMFQFYDGFGTLGTEKYLKLLKHEAVSSDRKRERKERLEREKKERLERERA